MFPHHDTRRAKDLNGPVMAETAPHLLTQVEGASWLLAAVRSPLWPHFGHPWRRVTAIERNRDRVQVGVEQVGVAVQHDLRIHRFDSSGGGDFGFRLIDGMAGVRIGLASTMLVCFLQRKGIAALAAVVGAIFLVPPAWLQRDAGDRAGVLDRRLHHR